MTNDASPALVVVDLVHRYGSLVAIDHVSLTVGDGEFVTILGPSGSGKTTFLRVIGGFEDASEAATLEIAGTDVRGLPANHRPVATVFQQYALFPHMSVGENIEYGMKLRKIQHVERRKRAEAALDLMRLTGKYDRRINQLSGGERQRVAFARAFVIEPRMLLLDEPMGALDEKLRRDMQVEVRNLQRTLGTTFLQVTHSQEEALTMSDRIVVMSKGHIEQIGTPSDIFERPETKFVAEFMGLRNILEGRISAISGDIVEIELADSHVAGRWTNAVPPQVGEHAFFAVHPSHVAVEEKPNRDTDRISTSGKVKNKTYKGAEVEVEIDTSVGLFTSTSKRVNFATDSVFISWLPELAVTGPDHKRTIHGN